jgi:hypothetical protein
MYSEQADLMLKEIQDFLISCGGPYTQVSGLMQLGIILALKTGQFVIGRDAAGNIEYYISYWRIQPEDVAGVMAGDNPPHFNIGPVIYVEECASKVGMKRPAVALRNSIKNWTGAFWYRYNKGWQIFANSKGE